MNQRKKPWNGGGFLHQWCNFSVRIPGCAAQPHMEDPMVCKHKFIRFHKDLCTWEAKTQFFWTWFNYSQQDKDLHMTRITHSLFFRWSSKPQIHGPMAHVNFGPGRSPVAVCDLQSTPQLGRHVHSPRACGESHLGMVKKPPIKCWFKGHGLLLFYPPKKWIDQLFSRDLTYFSLIFPVATAMFVSGIHRQVRTEVVVLRAHSSREGFLRRHPGIHKGTSPGMCRQGAIYAIYVRSLKIPWNPMKSH